MAEFAVCSVRCAAVLEPFTFYRIPCHSWVAQALAQQLGYGDAIAAAPDHPTYPPGYALLAYRTGQNAATAG